jgi:hypothetical protein
MGYSGARGTLIYEKNLMSKISCQTPFKLILKFVEKVAVKNFFTQYQKMKSDNHFYTQNFFCGNF